MTPAPGSTGSSPLSLPVLFLAFAACGTQGGLARPDTLPDDPGDPGGPDATALPDDVFSEVPDAGPTPLYRNDGTFLRDRAGRALLLRGINFPSDDVDYWKDRPPDQDRSDLALIAGSGFNAIRLVINWDRIEPQPDQYDADYIALVGRHARLAGELGLYVIVDLHQDLFGLGFGLHGAPRWACDEALYSAYHPIEPWFLNYFSQEVSACFDRFWMDGLLQSHHRLAARELAGTLAGIEGVLGFDPFNEPFPGTIPFDEFERDFLGPFHSTFGGSMGEVLPGRLVFFEPSVLISVNQATSFATSGTAPAAFFLPHYYNPTVETSKLWDGDAAADRKWVEAAAAEAKRLKAPWGLGEMGGALETPNLDAYLLSLYDLLDEAQAASFLWLFTRGTGGFGLVDEKTDTWHPVARAFLRPAPSAVAGTPTRYCWDPDSRVFELDWTEDPATGDTELLLPAWVKQVGYSVQLDGIDSGPLAESGPGRARIPGVKGGPRTLRLAVSAPYPG